MLATLLLLAQLVLPWPGLDSPLVQPGPTICVGECAGPVVWGPAERGRLVVACDMTSDTCSDGRKITTTRATPVPCETSPGVWEMVGVDQGCYSVRGLEAWAQNTSYLAWGAELDRGPWVGAAVPASQGYQITGPLSQSMAAVGVAEQRTTAWILRADTPRLVTIGVQPTGGCEVEVGTEWRTYSCTEQVAIGVSPEARITQPVGQSVYGIAAWHTRSATPGRPCWGGEAPVTCASDRHTISTEGWPTESGEISISFRVDEWAPGTRGYILDGRTSGDTSHTILLITTDGRLRLDLVAGAGQALGPVVALGEDHTVRLKVENGRTLVFYDGAKVIDVAGTPTWSHAAHIGHSLIAAEHLNGPISTLRVRSTE